MHEINVIGTMNLFAAASAPGSTVRDVVVKSSTLVYGAAPKDPVWFSEETPRAAAPRTPVERSLDRGRGLRPRLRRGQPARQRDAAAVLQRARARHRHAARQGARAAARAVGLRLRPPLPVRARGRRRAGDPVRARPSSVPGIYNVAGDGLLPVERGGRASAASAPFPLPPLGTGLLSPRRCAGSASTCRPSCSTCCATAVASTTAGSSRPGSTTTTPRPARSQAFVEALRLRRTVGEQRDRLPATSATSSSSSATPPPSSATPTGRRVQATSRARRSAPADVARGAHRRRP